MRWLVLRSLIPGLLMMASLAGCAPPASAPKPATDSAASAASPPARATESAAVAVPTAARAAITPERVNVGWVRGINVTPFVVAQGRGYFDQEGIVIEPSELRSGSDIVAALSTGQMDANSGNISAGTFHAWQRGVKLIVAGPTAIYPAEGLIPSNVVVRKELVDSGAVRSAADFRGRKVAINVRGGINEVIVSRQLARRGLTVDDVDLVTIAFPDMMSALANGAIDVMAGPEPFGTIAIDQGVGVRLEEDQLSVGELQPSHWLFSANFAESRADVAVRFLAAIMRATRDLQGNWPADPVLAKIIEDEVGFKPELIARSILPRFPVELVTRPEDVDALQEAFMRLGHLNYTTPMDVRPFVNSTLAQRAKARVDAQP